MNIVIKKETHDGEFFILPLLAVYIDKHLRCFEIIFAFTIYSLIITIRKNG